jgi:hypothetical protein
VVLASRALAVRIVRALEQAIPGVAFRTSLGGLSPRLASVGTGAVTPGTFATLGRLIRLSIIIAAALIAVPSQNVDITLLTRARWGWRHCWVASPRLGARTAISNIIGSHYLRQTFAVGQSVRIGDIEGTITALTSTSVILQVPDGTMIVPAKQFGEMPSTLLVKGDAP